MHQELIEEKRFDIEKGIMELIREKGSLMKKFLNISEKPLPEESIEMKQQWYVDRIKFLEETLHKLHELLEIIHDPGLREELADKINCLEDNKKSFAGRISEY